MLICVNTYVFHMLYVFAKMDIHYNDVVMSTIAYKIIGVSIVCLTVCSGAGERKYQSSAYLDFLRESTGHRWIPLTKG